MFSDQFIHISVTLLYNSPTVLALRGDVGVQFSEKSVTDI